MLLLALLGGLALLAVWLAHWPRLCLLLPPLLTGVALWRYRRQPPLELVLGQDGQALWLDTAGQAHPVQSLRWQERGPFWLLEARLEEKSRRFAGVGAPFSRSQRRALRLWYARHAARHDNRAAG